MYILRTIRTRKVREEYVILWLFTAIGIVILVVFENFSIFCFKMIKLFVKEFKGFLSSCERAALIRVSRFDSAYTSSYKIL